MKTAIQLEIMEGLNKGQSHQEVFDSLSEKYFKNGKLLTEEVVKVPIPARKEKYKFAWVFLLIILFAFLALKLLSLLLLLASQDIFGLLINLIFTGILIYVIISVFKYEKYTFQFLGFLGLANILWIVFFSRGNNIIYILASFMDLLLVAGMCIMSYLLYYKLFVKNTVETVAVKYANGKQGFERHAKFTER